VYPYLIILKLINMSTQLLFDNHQHTDTRKNIGPGTWNVIHTLSFHARTKEEQQAFIKTMKTICKHFPCKVCRGHCKTYIKEHPMEPFINAKLANNEKIGLFLWSWRFHNAVNVRLEKPTVSWEEAYRMYNTDIVGDACSQCSDEKSVDEHTDQPKNKEHLYFMIEAKKNKK
jgi:hypothetical protein